MQPTRETSRQADRLTDRDRRRCSDQALPCLTISLRQLGLPLISIPIVSYCSHQQFLDWLNLFGLRGCLHLPCSPTPSSPSLSTEAGYGEVAVRALASVCLCRKLSTFFSQRSFHVGRDRVFRKVQFDFEYSYFELGLRNIKKLVQDGCIEKEEREEFPWEAGQSFQRRSLWCQYLMDAIWWVVIKGRKTNNLGTFQLASRQQRISCECFYGPQRWSAFCQNDAWIVRVILYTYIINSSTTTTRA